jgi:polyphosphate kinase
MSEDRQHHDDDRPAARAPEAWVRASTAEATAHSTARPVAERTREVTKEVTAPIDTADPSFYLNRELSWLDFNERVLQLAEDERVPLLERVKFCAIYTTNLDEFYMVRVAGLRDQIDAGVENPGQDGRTPSETIALIRERVLGLGRRLTDCFEGQLRPALADHDIRVVGVSELDEDQRSELARHFQKKIFPALTPLAVAPGRPFPYISNLSLSLAVLVRDPISDQTVFARVKVPTEILPRFVTLKQPAPAPALLVPLEDVIAHHLDALFPGMEITDYDVFRVTRDADLEVSDDAADLLQAVEDELRRRRFGEIVRVEVGASCSESLREELAGLLGVQEDEVFPVDGLLDMGALWQIVKLPGHPELREEPVVGVTHPRLLRREGQRPDVLGAMREGDLLVHHPYISFSTSVERLVEQAVADPNVLAIKQTVYRTSDDSPLVPALIDATERGKQAVALVELKARFDERMNIHWARAMEEAGVHVVYGQPALKTHAKCVLVVRREGDGVRNYVHIGTGNYHSATARLYTDFGLFTTDEQIGADVADMFNYLTGYGRPLHYRKVLVAPNYLRDGIIAQIEQTIAAHSNGSPASISMKMNSLVDGRCIRALYAASQAGVRVDLNVRGICCLRPGVPGVSENIRVVSIVGRLLEHSRVYAFERNGEHTVYIASADLMPRNLDHRVELAVPIASAELRAELLDSLERAFADNQSSWELDSEGAWSRRSPGPGEQPRSLQLELAEIYAGRAAEEPRGSGEAATSGPVIIEERQWAEPPART